MNRKSVLVIVALISMIAAVSQANTIITAQSGNWTDPATWGSSVPASNGDNVMIQGNKVVTLNTSASLNYTTGNQDAFNIGDWGGTGGTLNVITNGTLNITGQTYLGENGTAYLNISGGTFNANYAMNVGFYGTAIVTITSGSMWAGNLQIGTLGVGEFHVDGGVTQVGLYTFGANATIDITKGRLVLPGNVSNVAHIIAYGGTGTVIYSYDSNANQTNVTAIPEPATMLIMGLGGLFFARKK